MECSFRQQHTRILVQCTNIYIESIQELFTRERVTKKSDVNFDPRELCPLNKDGESRFMCQKCDKCLGFEQL